LRLPGIERFRYENYRVSALLGSAGLVVVIAVVDAIVKPYISLRFFYLFPIMISAAFLPRWAVVIAGLLCAGLSALYGGLPMSWVRIGFETLAFAGCGLFASELFRNRQASLAAQGRMQILIETSPAAILTVNSSGTIEMANRAAVELLVPREGQLLGTPVAAFLPELHYALRLEEGPQLRSMLQCKGHRGKGETFTADVWFSTYEENGSPKLAAILADVSEETAAGNGVPSAPATRAEVSPRETEVLRLVVQGAANKEIANQMQLSESTIKATLQQLFAKTNVRTRAQLVRVALEQYRDLL
jgi:two-component system, LuxR family, sensor kinase FixL